MAKYVTLSLALAGAVLVGFWMAGCSDPEKNLNDPDSNKRAEAVRKLAERQDDAVVEKLAKAVEDPNVMVAVTAVESLGNMRNTPAARKALKKAATEEKRDPIRQQAVQALGKQGGKEAMEVLRQVIVADPDPRVRGQVPGAMAAQGSLEDIPLLVRVAETEQDPLVQTRAVRAIEAILGMKFRYDPGGSLAERKIALERIRLQAATIAANQQAALRARAQGKGR